jgi:predicted lipoprotein with Yx(FWY)xxD motif
MQVAYNGHLLYTFLNDVAPGDAKGQDLGDAWYVVSPAGDQVG